MAGKAWWTLTERNGSSMQPTDVQVARTLAALQHPSPERERPSSRSRDTRDDLLDDLPEGLLQDLEDAPSVRPDRLEEARDRLETGLAPSSDELANRIVGRLVCDRLAAVS